MAVYKEIKKADGSGTTTFYRLSNNFDTAETDNTEGQSIVIDYNEAQNKPSINGVALVGNKTSEELGLQPAGDYITNDEADAKFIDEDELLAKDYVNRFELEEALANIEHFHREIVDALPVTGKDNVLYLVRKPGAGEDIYNEYIWVGLSNSEDGYEYIGTTATDLTDYYKKPEVDAKLATKVDKVTGKGLSEQNYTLAEKTKLAGLENYDDSELQAKVDALHNYDDTELRQEISGIKNDITDLESDINDVALEASDKITAIRIVKSGDDWSWRSIKGDVLSFSDAQLALGLENTILYVEDIENDGKYSPIFYRSYNDYILVGYETEDKEVIIINARDGDFSFSNLGLNAKYKGIAADLPANGNPGDIIISSVDRLVYIWDGSNWVPFDKGGAIDLSNYLAKNNIMPWAPTDPFNPATKKYVDDIADNKLNKSAITNRNKVLTIRDGQNDNIVRFTLKDVGVEYYDDISGESFYLASKPYIDNALTNKQEKLISGTNIKTINGESLLGNGNIDVAGGDLSNYYNKQQTNALLENKVNQWQIDYEYAACPMMRISTPSDNSFTFKISNEGDVWVDENIAGYSAHLVDKTYVDAQYNTFLTRDHIRLDTNTGELEIQDGENDNGTIIRPVTTEMGSGRNALSYYNEMIGNGFILPSIEYLDIRFSDYENIKQQTIGPESSYGRAFFNGDTFPAGTFLESGNVYVAHVGTEGVPLQANTYPIGLVPTGGTQTITLSNGNGDTQVYPFNLGSLTLKGIRIGDVNNSDTITYRPWESAYYLTKNVGTFILNGSETYTYDAIDGVISCKPLNISPQTGALADNFAVADKIKYLYANEFGKATEGFRIIGDTVYIKVPSVHSAEEAKTYFTNNNLGVWFYQWGLAETKITDTTLISQLDAFFNGLYSWGRYDSLTISVTGDASPKICYQALYDYANIPGRLSAIEQGLIPYKDSGFPIRPTNWTIVAEMPVIQDPNTLYFVAPDYIEQTIGTSVTSTGFNYGVTWSHITNNFLNLNDLDDIKYSWQNTAPSELSGGTEYTVWDVHAPKYSVAVGATPNFVNNSYENLHMYGILEQRNPQTTALISCAYLDVNENLVSGTMYYFDRDDQGTPVTGAPIPIYIPGSTSFTYTIGTNGGLACLDGDTPIKTTKTKTKPIKEVAVDDIIIDAKGNKTKVIKTFNHKVNTTFNIELSNGDILVASYGHKFSIEGHFRRACQVVRDHKLQRADTSTFTVTSVEIKQEEREVYEILTESGTYVLGNDLICECEEI